ncbi:prolipoprotein diacylglyceryl transferase [Clostridium sp. 'White wine YQ']|uniref:prolipoprotein diacylglyceryl transferase n=1 Tax=Clostridium sp. 'White wine YQ' TaxID=3027474 RepID=UPI002366A1D3|nr:prolipoprotein diacylglyceryl transferase [Clostridium sp. 'White wine YQ']MDD7795096.1 prolipoprotein diacylglyceryl transferase [Clostridium sp. 'White wine YQ']
MKFILFEIFGVEVYGYGFMIALGIIIAILLIDKRGKKRGYNVDHIFNMTLIAVLSGVIGGKVLYYITEWKSIINEPKLLIDNIGAGFVIYGAIIGGAIGVVLYSRKKGWNLLEIFDLIIPTVALAQGFGRIGCFLAGCCYGKETDLPIGVVFPENSLAPFGVRIIPTQLFSAVFDILLSLILFRYDLRNKKNGRVFALYLIIYSTGRFIIEFFRDDPRGAVSVLSTSQFISIFTLIAGILLFNISKILKREKEDVKKN